MANELRPPVKDLEIGLPSVKSPGRNFTTARITLSRGNSYKILTYRTVDHFEHAEVSSTHGGVAKHDLMAPRRAYEG